MALPRPTIPFYYSARRPTQFRLRNACRVNEVRGPVAAEFGSAGKMTCLDLDRAEGSSLRHTRVMNARMLPNALALFCVTSLALSETPAEMRAPIYHKDQ